MNRLLIVDDEPDIADGLYTLFKRQETIELEIYKAYSGPEALERLYNTQIDIMLLDINMPGMSGLELLEKIKINWPKCWVIFLTGYNEFDYVYTAMKYDRVSYLLKVEEHVKIIQTVEKVLKEIKDSYKNNELIRKAEERMISIKPILQKEYLLGLLQGEDVDNKLQQDRFEELEIPMNYRKPFLLLLGRVDSINNIANRIEKEKLLCTIQLISEEYFHPKVIDIFISCENNLLVWIIQPGEFYEVLGETDMWKVVPIFVKENVERVQNILKDSKSISISYVVDAIPVNWNEISDRYSSLKLLLYSQIGFRSNILYFRQHEITENTEKTSKAYIPGNHAQFNVKKTNMLEVYLESRQKEKFQALLVDVFEGLKEQTSKHYNPFLEIFYTVSLMFLSYINRWNLSERLAFKIGLNKLTRVDEFDSWNSAIEYFIYLSNLIFELHRNEEENSTVHVVSRISQYISENIDKELSLVRLAEMVYLNPQYLSRLFKQQTGGNLLSYINEIRINKAKELLANHTNKIQHIGSAVGFNSPSYFTQFFKKATGISPQEYRDMVLKNN